MNINIDIECETILELEQHLMELREQVKTKTQELGLVDHFNEFPDGTHIDDTNCYGTHVLHVQTDLE